MINIFIILLYFLVPINNDFEVNIDRSNKAELELLYLDDDQKLYERLCPDNRGTFLQCLFKEGSECSSLDETYCG